MKRIAPKKPCVFIHQVEHPVSLLRDLLIALLDSHRHPALTKLSYAVRQKDYKGMYDAAGFLSQQQYEGPDEHFIMNQFSLLLRKYPFDPTVIGTDPRGKAISSFNAAEKRCQRVNKRFDVYSYDINRSNNRGALRSVQHHVRSILGSKPDYADVFSSSDFGGGASVGVHGSVTHGQRKLTIVDKTVTPSALHHGFAAIMANHHSAEEYFPMSIDGRYYCYDMESAFSSYISSIRVVTNNKVDFVPKNCETLRGIAIEPLLNGLVQKGIDQVMRRKLLRTNIDLSDQTRNQRMAREGSLEDSERSFVTIDLSRASDSLSDSVCRFVLPPDWYLLLDATRSKFYEMDGVLLPYHKFVSMGNGFCFPLETTLFTAICLACDAGTPGTDFSVYGDDIIVRKEVSERVLKLLKIFGFSANVRKTFLEGPFRESCGGDFFHGQDVRPLTLDFALDTNQSIFKFLNLTTLRERTEKFFLPIRDLLIKRIPSRYLFIRPFPGTDDSAITSLGDEHLRFSTKHLVFDRRYATWRWYELETRPLIDKRASVSIRAWPRAMWLALRGTPSRGGIPAVALRFRTETKLVRKHYSSTSNWLPIQHPVRY